MKKVLFVAVAMVALCAMPSCKKVCTCTNNYDDEVSKIETTKEYPTCKDIEDVLDAAGMGIIDSTCR